MWDQDGFLELVQNYTSIPNLCVEKEYYQVPSNLFCTKENGSTHFMRKIKSQGSKGRIKIEPIVKSK